MASKAATKSEIMKSLSDSTGLSKKEVAAVFDALGGVIKVQLKKANVFMLPGLVKLRVIHKPATKAKQGINPFTKEPMMIKAKPARKVVRAAALKALKDAVA
jgi:nucleoid DNA-binding protein